MPGATVAVCLATHRPDPALLRRQLASLDAQTYGDRMLVREDDDAGSGAWRAFERCFVRVPADAAFVAPCDQDDVWRPDKLAVLVDALERSGAVLAYSDVRVVRPDGTVLSETYWTDRANGADDLGDLLATNVVTGAACLFRRAVLDVALPFPREVDGAHHDHWIALCALALGDLAYVDAPLVDYVQHGANLVGHAPRAALAGRARRRPRRPARRARPARPRAPRRPPAGHGPRPARPGRRAHDAREAARRRARRARRRDVGRRRRHPRPRRARAGPPAPHARRPPPRRPRRAVAARGAGAEGRVAHRATGGEVWKPVLDRPF